ncbi:MAG: type II toxin-antitoxin system Phd/YefM family antitoxin [Ignavibacteria bacterium]|nr:type II toxin-antitoxin system Phd/YefM family antitoxin [Ignavibacteria bacterium]
MKKTWQLQEAKNKLSQVMDAAVDGYPQVITRRGVETAVLLSYEDYRRLSAPSTTLAEFFRASPLVGVDLELRRDTSPSRRPPAL